MTDALTSALSRRERQIMDVYRLGAARAAEVARALPDCTCPSRWSCC